MLEATLFQLRDQVSGAAAALDAHVKGLGTDSRKVVPGELFVALRGERFDAHDFLTEVAAQGAAAVVVERLPEGLAIPALVVPDTRRALAEIAAWWRDRFDLPVIGVTGSNGKTTVKEMIASILQAKFGAEHCLSTSGNLNNDIGVPLTALRLLTRHRAAVIELGMNHPGEIAELAAVAQPNVGLVNNAQREHQEFMHTVQAVAEENGAVIASLPNDGVAVFPAGDTYTELWRKLAGSRRVLSFGLAVGADVHGSYLAREFGSDVTVTIAGRSFAVKLAAAGAHNVANALAAAACCHAIGIADDVIARGLEAFAPVSGRLQSKRAANGAHVIDDTYNANPDSVRAAIAVLAASDKGVLVLGDMGEVGAEGEAFHREIGAFARSSGIARLFAIGDLAAHAAQAFGAGAVHCADLTQLQTALDQYVQADSTVLVKGSRFMKMERVVQYLTKQQSTGSH